MELAELSDELEIISRVYERRFGVPRTDDWLVLKLHEEVGELTQAYLARSGRSRDRGAGAGEVDAAFRAELADVLAQLLLVARRFDVDLEAELERKWFRWRHLVEPQDEAGVRAAAPTEP
ncbi:pyrophosphatase [Isoptericola sp. F-RaC21]|uniref:pyrophosphatase n=1 Tax=Isoptericola sp. F-RaC21 TaxID=3141452 RepID=UPI00315BD63F